MAERQAAERRRLAASSLLASATSMKLSRCGLGVIEWCGAHNHGAQRRIRHIRIQDVVPSAQEVRTVLHVRLNIAYALDRQRMRITVDEHVPRLTVGVLFGEPLHP